MKAIVDIFVAMVAVDKTFFLSESRHLVPFQHRRAPAAGRSEQKLLEIKGLRLQRQVAGSRGGIRFWTEVDLLMLFFLRHAALSLMF